VVSGSLARRYARALVSLGQDDGNVERLVADLDTFDAVLDLSDGELRKVLCNPGLTSVERKSIIEEVLERLALSTHTANFLRLLVDKNRLAAFDAIRTATHDMADELAGRVRATVTTATPLDKSMAATVQSALEETTGKTVIIAFAVDSSLIGGMVAQVGDISYDASIRARLESLQQALIRNPGALTAEA
jgi:F-type H+-transporting ATPase subunit delta